MQGAVLNAEKATSDTAHAHKVKVFYPFAQIRSWEVSLDTRIRLRTRLTFAYLLLTCLWLLLLPNQPKP